MTVRTDARPQLRVVQWASGNIGSRALRAVLEHPDLTLAGLYAHTPDKAGRDAGELCGLGPTGVIATHDIDEIVALGADCVLYMPRACDMDEVCRLLASGANVVTTRGEFHRAASLDPAVRERVEAACESGKSSIHSTGSSPGFITEALPLALSSIQRRLDGLTIEEFADLSQRDSPGLLFDVMGFGKPPAEYDERPLSVVRDSFGPSLHMVADTLSIPLDSGDRGGGRDRAPPRRHRGGHPAAEHRGRPADHGLGTARRPTVAALPGHLVLHHRPRPRLGRPRHRLAHHGRRRRTARHGPALPGAPGPDGRHVALVHGEPRRQRRTGAVRGVPGIRSTADLPHIVARLG
ncbi:dihydrodipicolinate reductase [Streptomyces mirabilis]|uniref:dihydrodipicolinate reductase n=1 Tax=Streptomyces mirabilis TaxID=68239 RepID=UPI00369F31E3